MYCRHCGKLTTLFASTCPKCGKEPWNASNANTPRPKQTTPTLTNTDEYIKIDDSVDVVFTGVAKTDSGNRKIVFLCEMANDCSNNIVPIMYHLAVNGIVLCSDILMHVVTDGVLPQIAPHEVAPCLVAIEEDDFILKTGIPYSHISEIEISIGYCSDANGGFNYGTNQVNSKVVKIKY